VARSVSPFLIVLTAAWAAGCTAPADEPDAGAGDAGMGTDAGYVNPWADRPPLRYDAGAGQIDAGCPGREEPSAMRSFELDTRGFRLGSATATPEGGLWIAGTAADARRPLALRLSPEGALAASAALPLDSDFAARGATTEDGGLVVAYVSGGTLIVVTVGSDGAIVHSLKVDPQDDFRFEDAPLVAVDADGVYVAAAIRTGTLGARGVHLLRLGVDGAALWQRQVHGPRIFVVPTALAAAPDGALLVTRTDGFSARTFVPVGSGVELHASAPWILRFEGDGELRWQRSLDADVGENLVLDVVARRGETWVLGGGTDVTFQQPWLVEVREDGLLQSSTVLDGIPSTRVAGLRSDRDGLEVIQGSSLNLMVGRVSSDTLGLSELLSLDGQLALAAGTPRGVFFVGPLPSCGDAERLSVRDLAPFCTARRDLGVAWLPAGRAGACLRALRDTAWTAQTLEHPMTIVNDPGLSPVAIDLEVTALGLDAAPLSPASDRHCFAGASCPTVL
jgi:hypothetical protein